MRLVKFPVGGGEHMLINPEHVAAIGPAVNAIGGPDNRSCILFVAGQMLTFAFTKEKAAELLQAPDATPRLVS